MIECNLVLTEKGSENNSNNDKRYFVCMFIAHAFDTKLSDSCTHALQSLSKCVNECHEFQKILHIARLQINLMSTFNMCAAI